MNPLLQFNSHFKQLSFIILLLLYFVPVSGQVSYPHSITFTSQSQLDTFSSGYTIIEGDLQITGPSIYDLRPLANITTVNGNFKIIENAMLSDLTGINNLTTVNGSFNLGGNPNIIDLSPLNALSFIGGNFSLGSMPVTDLSPFAQMSGIGAMDTVLISGLYNITNLVGLENITQVNTFYILGNLSLLSLDGLGTLTNVTNELVVFANPLLDDCCAFYHILNELAVGGMVQIFNNGGNCATQNAILEFCAIDNDEDGFSPADGDCDDMDDTIYPGAVEVCDGIDNNCDGHIDEGFEDNDNDGICDELDSDDDNDGCLDNNDPNPLVASIDSDGDSSADDCDLCIGNDNAGDTDNDGICNDLDDDDDGDGILDIHELQCGSDPYNYNSVFTDSDNDGICDDMDVEECDGLDNDGDGMIDEDLDCYDGICESYSFLSHNKWIKKVKIKNLNNNSGNNDGYGDFKHMSANLKKRKRYRMSLHPGQNDSNKKSYWRVWVDWNNDGDFDDHKEKIGQWASKKKIKAYLKVPRHGVRDTVTMRVSMKLNGYADPCSIFEEGEVEDYTIITRAEETSQSKVRDLAESEEKSSKTISVFPNPTTAYISVKLHNHAGKPGLIQISNQYGTIVYRQEYKQMPTGNLQIQTIDFPAGVYKMMYKEEGKRMIVETFIVIRM